MARDTSFRDFVLEQLHGFAPVRAKSMFGGYGLYAEDIFFGLIADGRLYFLTDEESRKDYLAAGSDCFKPNQKQTLGRYFEVPVEVLEESDSLARWAARAVAARFPQA